ncbi:hypothetical protein V8D89_000948 [Ganoderma adspersum]
MGPSADLRGGSLVCRNSRIPLHGPARRTGRRYGEIPREGVRLGICRKGIMRTRCREVSARRLWHAVVDGVEGTALHAESDGDSGRRRREEHGAPWLGTGSGVPRPAIRCRCVIEIFAAWRKEKLTGAVTGIGRERIRPTARRRRWGRGRGWERSQVCRRHSVLPVASLVGCGCKVEDCGSVNGDREGGKEEVELELVDGGSLVDVTVFDRVVVGASVVLEVVLEEVVVEEVAVEEVVVVEPGEDEAESKQLVSSLGWIVRGPALATWLALSRSKKETVCPAGTGKTQGNPSPPNG